MIKKTEDKDIILIGGNIILIGGRILFWLGGGYYFGWGDRGQETFYVKGERILLSSSSLFF